MSTLSGKVFHFILTHFQNSKSQTNVRAKNRNRTARTRTPLCSFSLQFFPNNFSSISANTQKHLYTCTLHDFRNSFTLAFQLKFFYFFLKTFYFIFLNYFLFLFIFSCKSNSCSCEQMFLWEPTLSPNCLSNLDPPRYLSGTTLPGVSKALFSRPESLQMFFRFHETISTFLITKEQYRY